MTKDRRAGGMTSTGVGPMIRRWRKHRRWSQMELSFEARLSARHVSFIETGRSTPSRDAVLAIASALEIPLRERNALLEAAGHAREYRERDLHSADTGHLRAVLTRLLDGHEPWFAVAIDHRWDILLANGTARGVLDRYVGDGGVPGPPNLMRLTLHPAGYRSTIENLDAVAGRLLASLEREVARRPADEALARLLDEVGGYGPEGRGGAPVDAAVPMRLRTPRGEAGLLTVLMTFDNPLDPLTDDLRIETLVPEDEESEAVLRDVLSPPREDTR